ncbi:hypothetical protein TI39_contig4129g00008 [Zymoseptoria brevis]|uniref:Uncharacterized protein n=1 Tax=Zymoseptoria brevis TaxID=1047168 RepID=A0A0F4GCR9_9PEZI|nr:hypothetical protein TI39_contig4129g00008 [Zymoseptoria brevis]
MSSTTHNCTECSVSTPSLVTATNHVNASNQVKQQWRCPGCNTRFCIKNDLVNHTPNCDRFNTWRRTMKWGKDLSKARVNAACDFTEQRAGAVARVISGVTQASQIVPPPAMQSTSTNDNNDSAKQLPNRSRKRAAEEKSSDEGDAEASEATGLKRSRRSGKSTATLEPMPQSGLKSTMDSPAATTGPGAVSGEAEEHVWTTLDDGDEENSLDVDWNGGFDFEGWEDAAPLPALETRVSTMMNLHQAMMEVNRIDYSGDGGYGRPQPQWNRSRFGPSGITEFAEYVEESRKKAKAKAANTTEQN